MSVPRSEEVERMRPEGGQERDDRGLAWAMMMLDLAEGVVGVRREEEGELLDGEKVGGGQGGR
jgi:hypothetical protein